MNLKFLLALVGGVFFAYLLMRDLTRQPAGGVRRARRSTPTRTTRLISYFSTGAENYLMGTALLPLFLFFLFRALARPALVGICGRRDRHAPRPLPDGLAVHDVRGARHRRVSSSSRSARGNRGARRRCIAGKAALIGGIWAAIVFLPLVLPMIRESRASPWLNVSGEATALSRSLVQSFQIGLGNPGYLVLLLTVGGLPAALAAGGGAARTVRRSSSGRSSRSSPPSSRSGRA